VTTEVMFRQDRFRVRTENLLEWDKRYQYAHGPPKWWRCRG
jgi:general secretion pathway protein K